MWHLMALSSVLGCDVVSVYPDLIGTVRDRHLFHKIIKPRFRRSNDTVRIMWTSLATQSKYDRWWLPNHFVACTKGTIEEAQPTSHQEPTGLTLADFFYPMSRAKNNRQRFKIKNTKPSNSTITTEPVHKQDQCENLVTAKIIEADTGTNTNTSTVNLDTIHKLDLADSVTKVKSEPILSMNQEPNKYSSTNIAAMEPEIIHKDDKSENMTEAGCEKVSQFDTKQDITTNVTEGTPDTVCEQDEPEIRTATGSEPLSQPDTLKEPDYIMDGEQHFHEDLPENLLYENVSFQFYYKMGRLAALNESRDKTRYLNPIEKDHENVDKKVKRTLLNETIISKLEPLQKKMMCEVKRLKRAHISAIIASGRYILDHGPIVKTQNLCNVFFNAKDSYQGIEVTVKRRKMSIELLETLSKYLPVMQIYINKTAYIMEYRSGDIQEFVDTVTEAVNFREVANRNLEETLDSLQDYMKFVDTVLDRNIIRSILVELYSVNSVSHLEGAKSKQTLRRARDEIPRKMKTFKDLKTNLMTVRNDMNNNQQQNLHKRLVSKMKAKKFKSRAKGAGRQKVADKFPQLAEVLELAFGEGSKIHPRLTSETRYKNPDLALTMAEARKILLTAASDKIPNIALSTCYTYTENYRKNSRQALRHHIDHDVNAKISLRKLPRVGMMEERVNAHYCRANVNFHLDMAANDKDDCLVDAKDAKGVICADIDPVQNIGKSWKKDNRLDHQFDQSRTNACTPMTHLFLQSITSDAIIHSDNLTLMNVVRTGQPVTLVNISFFEPETIFRCFNELFLLLSIPALDMFFRNPSTHTLKKKWIFVVDNGPSEAPASTLVRMLLVRLVNFMNLEKATQISFEKLNSKDNPAERPHAAENLVLSRHGPFKSKELFIHKNSKPGSSDHLENMEAMAKDVIGCLRSAKFGSNQFFCFRGIQDQYIFNDETSLRNFLKLSEQGKDNCHTEYTTTDCPLLTDICHAWELQREFNGNYLDDYNHLSNSIDDDIRTAWLTEYSATIFSRNNNLEYRYVKEPLPDYIRWLSSNGELHYMCYEARQAVPFGEWDSEEQFLPTRILNLIGELFVDIPESVLDSVSLLTWLTPDQVQKELVKMTEKMSSQLKNEEIKERWKTHDLFKKTVAELQNEAKQLNIPNAMKSSKTELVENIAQSKALTVPPDVDTYDGSLSDISMDLNSLTNLSIFQLKSILKYHNLNYRGTKDELVMKVFLLRHKRSYMIIESVVSKITKLGEIAVSLIIWQRRHYNELKHVHRQRQYSVFKSSKTKSIIAVPEHITEENLHEAFDPFFDWLDNVLKSKLEIDQERQMETKHNSNKPDPYEQCKETGAKLKMYWSRAEIGTFNWDIGWYVASVVSYDEAFDSLDIEYQKEPGCVYSVDYTPNFLNGKLKFISSPFYS